MTHAVLQREANRQRTWLRFETAPPPAIREQLKRTGWMYQAEARAWCFMGARAVLPEGLTVIDQGERQPPDPRPNTARELLEVLLQARAVARRQRRE
jgi:hypothetical protein